MNLERIDLQPYEWWSNDNGKIPNASCQPKREQILKTIHEKPGINATQIAKLTNLSLCCVNYHIDCMARWQQISCYILPSVNRRYYFPSTYRAKKLRWSQKVFNQSVSDSDIEEGDRVASALPNRILAQKVVELERQVANLTQKLIELESGRLSRRKPTSISNKENLDMMQLTLFSCD